MSEEQEPTDARTTKPRNFFTGLCQRVIANPIIGVFALVFGLIGTGFGFYTYNESIRDRELSFYVNPARTPIVQKGKLENFTVSFAGRAITGDLSSIEIQLWNAGKESIRKEHILKPITIQTANNSPIYQVTCEIKRDVINPTITPTDGTSGIITLGWNIMEKGDGVKLNVIFGGDVRTPIVVGGVIEGQRMLNQILPPIAKRDTWQAGFQQIVLLALCLATCYLFWIIGVALLKSNKFAQIKQRAAKVFLGIIIIGAVLASNYGAFCLFEKCLRYTVAPVIPPYGF